MAVTRWIGVRAVALLLLLCVGMPASAGGAAAPKDAYLYIGWPLDGAIVSRTFRVWFGLRNMGVAPAGVELPMTGHHHLIIDAPLPPADAVIPSDRNHLHFGRGQTENVLTLPLGKHTLQLMMGDHAHRPHENPVVSRKITITVR